MLSLSTRAEETAEQSSSQTLRHTISYIYILSSLNFCSISNSERHPPHSGKHLISKSNSPRYKRPQRTRTPQHRQPLSPTFPTPIQATNKNTMCHIEVSEFLNCGFAHIHQHSTPRVIGGDRLGMLYQGNPYMPGWVPCDPVRLGHVLPKDCAWLDVNRPHRIQVNTDCTLCNYTAREENDHIVTVRVGVVTAAMPKLDVLHRPYTPYAAPHLCGPCYQCFTGYLGANPRPLLPPLPPTEPKTGATGPSNALHPTWGPNFK